MRTYCTEYGLRSTEYYTTSCFLGKSGFNCSPGTPVNDYPTHPWSPGAELRLPTAHRSFNPPNADRTSAKVAIPALDQH